MDILWDMLFKDDFDISIVYCWKVLMVLGYCKRKWMYVIFKFYLIYLILLLEIIIIYNCKI